MRSLSYARGDLSLKKRGPTLKSARSIALAALMDVDLKGAYAGLALTRLLDGAVDLSAEERAFAAELTYGTVRWRKYLDWAIENIVDKPAALSVLGRNLLRLGLYQLLFIPGMPAHAAVYETVALAADRGERGLARLTNWALREHLRRGGHVPLPSMTTDPVRYLSVRYSHPEWLVRRWLARWGFERTEQALIADNEPAPLTARVNKLRTTRDELIQRLAAERVTAKPVGIVPEGIILSAPGALAELPSFREGLFTIQDTASMLIGHVMAPAAGETILDACAAPGGKTTHLAELMGNTGRIIATDLHPSRLGLVLQAANRLGLGIIETAALDARHLLDHRAELGIPDAGVDRVLVDAPCSGLGVLRRRPDLRWRKSEEEIRKLPVLQIAVLEAASMLVRPGGVVVYSTCTTEPEENDGVVASFLARHPEFVLVSPPESITESAARYLDGKLLRIMPGQAGGPGAPDGFFAARMIRTA